MFELDKQKFGAFVAQLRKERRMTQKELAEKLFISDKAISKWETGVSIPDTALLIPLAQLLGVSVTELLLSQRMHENHTMDNLQVEDIVKTAISYSEKVPARVYRSAGKWFAIYVLSVVMGISGMILCEFLGGISEVLMTSTVLGVVFGAYFCFFAKEKLPQYHDENRIHGMMDGPFRMNVPGISFNNSNWPHIVQAGRIWACGITGLYPILSAVMLYGKVVFWMQYEKYIMLAVMLGGLFIPIYVVGKKYQ